MNFGYSSDVCILCDAFKIATEDQGSCDLNTLSIFHSHAHIILMSESRNFQSN